MKTGAAPGWNARTSPFVSLTRVEAAEAGEPMPHDMEHGMSGLVLAISVPPGSYRAQAPAEAPRDIRLLVQRRERVFAAEAGYGFVVAGDREPARDSIEIPAPAPGDSLTLRIEGPFAGRPWRIDLPLRSAQR